MSHQHAAAGPGSLADLLRAAGRDPLAAELQRALRERCGVRAGSSLLVGCSGGPDSVALTVLLAALSRRRTPFVGSLRVVHVDHGLRPESAAEADDVRRLGARLELPVEVHRVEVPTGPGHNVAEAAREVRYAQLSEVAVHHGCDGILTAHHAEDRFETMVHALCRGAGVDGLAQPRWVRSLGNARLMRPLLAISRVALRDFCERLDLPFLDAPDNRDPGTVRGFLREEVLPRLESRWPGAGVRASAAADRLAVAADVLQQALDPHFGASHPLEWDRSLLRTLGPDLTATGWRQVLLRLASDDGVLDGGVGSTRLMEAARAACDEVPDPRSFDFGSNRLLRIDSARARILREA
ncbi:MAG: tRNA lysidine(34) synthetase TilS [Planctomycetota bacterium]|nr:tRNA lysidine(34) synthetase TilS [Planctomycetota bacterium]